MHLSGKDPAHRTKRRLRAGEPVDRDQWPVWASRRQDRADDSHLSRGARSVGDDRERRRADIAKPIGPRNSARRPPQRLYGIALSGVATPLVVEPQRDLAVAEQVRNGPVRHAGVEHGRRDVVAQVLERHVRVAARLGKPIAQRVRSDRRGPLGLPAKMYSPGRGSRPVCRRDARRVAIADGGPGVGLVRKPTKESDWRDVPLIDSARAAFERQLARRREHSRRRPRRKERTALVCELPSPLCGYILPKFPPDRGISHPHEPL